MSTKKILLWSAGVLGLFSLAVALPPKTHAVTAGEWRPGNIISDPLFFNGNDMSQNDVQLFLNAHVPVCDTWGTKMHSSGMTRAQYGTSIGVPPPYICVRDYYENPTTHETNFNPSASIPAGAKSAAQIIYEASVRYNVNPKVILVTIKKEAAENLLGDDWPWLSQYRSALGYGCPDTAPCDVEYYGFYNQVENAAKQFRRYATYPSDYRVKMNATNFIQYNPNAACSGTNVYVESQATAGLYNYTPYQPNAAALTNMYGSGDSCSAYGNRNFWRIWNDWFGPTTDERLFYRLIRGDASGEVYIQTHQGKYYVPSYELLAEWKMGPNDLITLPQSQVTALPSKGTISNVLTDGAGKLYVVEGGNIHEVVSPNHTAIWGVDTSHIVDSLGLSYALSKKEPLGRFMTVRGGDGSIWLSDGQVRHKITSGELLYAWGYYPGITNTVSPYFFAKYVPKEDTTSFASADGSTIWAIDASTKSRFKDGSVKSAYMGSAVPMQVSIPALNLLNTGSTPLTRFVRNTETGQWFVVDNGKKYYIPQGELAALWGKPDNEAMSQLSPYFMNTLPAGGNIGFVAQSSTTSQYWLIAKNKHAIVDTATLVALTGSTNAPLPVSDDVLNSLPTGTNATMSIKGLYSPYNYPYALDAGQRRYPSSAAAQGAWSRTPVTVPSELIKLIPEGAFVSNVVRSASGGAYYVDGGQKYAIPTAYRTSWAVDRAPVVADNSLLQFVDGGVIGDTLSTPTGDYLLSYGQKILIGRYRDSYPTVLPGSKPVNGQGIPTYWSEASYIIASNIPNDSRVWFINQGTKLPLSFEQAVTLGYLSKGLPVFRIAQPTIDAIPTTTAPFIPLIQRSGSGIKLLNFGNALGFPDGATLTAYVDSTKGVMQVSPSIYDTFSVNGSASRVIYDDAGMYWWVENGTRRYITSWSKYSSLGYPSNLPSGYLYGTTHALLPIGAPVQ